MKKPWVSSKICEKKNVAYVIYYACEDACKKLANVKSVTCEMFLRGRWDAPARTPCVYRVIVPVRWGTGGDGTSIKASL